MPRFPTRKTSRVLTLLSLSALTGLSACKKNEKEEDKAASEEEAKESSAPSAEPSEEAKKPKPVAVHGRFDRGKGLGHVLFANPGHFIGELKEQAAPQFAAMFLSEAVLRGYLGSSLGERGPVSENLRFDLPLGCAVIEAPKPELPMACIVGYSGGAKSLVNDLGAEGKQDDAQGHTGYYKLADNDVFIDGIDEMVVVSNETSLFKEAKTYLQRIMIERAGSLKVDVEVVAFPTAAFKRYDEELTGFIEEFQRPSPEVEGEGEFAQSLEDYSALANEESLEEIKSTEQFVAGLGLDDQGLLAQWEVYPEAGSPSAKRNAGLAAKMLSSEHFAHLPASSWGMYAGRTFTTDEDSRMRNAAKQMVVSFVVERTGKDKESIQKEVDKLFADLKSMYGDASAGALLHLPETEGGFVAVLELQDGKSGREAWKEWSKSFTPESVLGKEDAKKVEWTFEIDAAKVDDVPVDRWTIKPTAAGRKELRADFPQWDKRTDGYTVVIERAEVGGKAILALAMGDDTPAYTKEAIEAVKGTDSLAKAPGYGAVAKMAEEAGTVYALDLARATDWLRTVVPESDAQQIPKKLGVDLSDVVGANRWKEDGSSTGEVRVSQAVIDQIRAMVDAQQQQ